MKRIWFMLGLILIWGTTTVAATHPRSVQSAHGLFQPVLTIAGEKIQGSVRSLIIQTREAIYLFNDHGRCEKEFKLGDRVWPLFKISTNHRYLAIMEPAGGNSGENVLNLYHCNGSLIWSNSAIHLNTIINVADDGKSVLVRDTPDKATEYYVTKYLNESGTVTAVASGNEVESSQGSYAVSANGERWITRNTTGDQWSFYHRDKLLRVEPIRGRTIKAIGNNGIALMVETLPNQKTALVLYNSKGRLFRINTRTDMIYLSPPGTRLFYPTVTRMIFESVIFRRPMARISKKHIDRYTRHQSRVWLNLPYYGFVLAEISPKPGHGYTLLYLDQRGKYRKGEFPFQAQEVSDVQLLSSHYLSIVRGNRLNLYQIREGR